MNSNYDRNTTKGTNTTAKTTTTREQKVAYAKTDVAQEKVVPVIEEELKVGKREVNKGGVRVSSRVVETPVQEDVSLREEHVRVERHPVDRPVEARDLENFKGGTVEFVETDQEAVVAKKARIIEEVVISKEVTQRTDRINETLRHTEVQVDQIPATGATSATQFEQYDSTFRQDFASGGYSQYGYEYEQVIPAYRFGYHLGTSDTYKGRDWEAIEPEASVAWEERNPGTWEHVKMAARHAWDKVTGKI